MKFSREHPITFGLIFMLGCAGLASLLIIDYPVQPITITIDYSDIQEQSVTPVWNTLNVWDISFLDGKHSDYIIESYKERQFFIDHLNLMTATGGRSQGTNKMYCEDLEGNPIYNFTKIMTALDWVIQANFTATIVLGNTPIDMTAGAPEDIDYGAFDANTGVPEDYSKYFDYIANMTNAVIDHSGNNISRFEWRIMTEPDNADWLMKNSIENYFNVYITTVRAIRSVLPNATIEMGNFMEEDPEKVLKPFLQRILNEAPDTIPNIVGFSCYGNGQVSARYQDIGDVSEEWHKVLEKDLGLKNIRVAIEEGQLLNDGEGGYLWQGDATEFGAAWNAGVFQECIENNVDWYAQWGFYAGEIRSPSLNVIEIYEKIEGYNLVSTKVKYSGLVKEHQKRLNGFGALAPNSNESSLLIYYADQDRFSTDIITVQIELTNFPMDDSSISQNIYLVDKSHSNYFWDYYKEFGNETRGKFSGTTCSVWDMHAAISLYGTQAVNKWYVWSWERRNDYHLEQITGKEFIVDANNPTTLTLNLDVAANSVYLWQFIPN